MSRKAVKTAYTNVQPYAERPLPGGGSVTDRIDKPVRQARNPYLCVDYDTRELCVTPTLRIPLEKVDYYELAEADEAPKGKRHANTR